MVGTTRPRISLFMQRFHNLGLIETNKDRFLIIKEKKLTDHLAQSPRAAAHLREPTRYLISRRSSIGQQSIPSQRIVKPIQGIGFHS